ncbi:uncharacterized protein LOC143302081 isoform X2 [Babylonia areolata]
MVTIKRVFLSLAVLLAVIMSSLVGGHEDVHNYEANGVVCHKCPPGTYVDKHCVKDFTNSTCISCQNHTYMNTFNDKKGCQSCKSSCPKNGEEVQACTATTNRQCRCDIGFHQFPIDAVDDHYECEPHSSCDKPGQGVKHYGNHSHNTQCEQCREGEQFVDASDPKLPRCRRCSACLDDSVIVANCSLSSDTVCSKNFTVTVSPTGPENDSDGLNGGAITGIIIGGVLIVAAVIFVTVFIIRRRSNSDSGRSGLGNGVTRGMRNGGTRGSTGINMDAAQQLLGQTWTLQFIDSQVCFYLSNHLGEEWKRFILQLPGWPEPGFASTVIEHKVEEEATVPNRIMGCLKEWMRRVDPAQVTKESIVGTLTTLEKGEVVEALETLASQYDASGSPSAAAENGHA